MQPCLRPRHHIHVRTDSARRRGGLKQMGGPATGATELALVASGAAQEVHTRICMINPPLFFFP